MMRTAVNIAGDGMVATTVARTEGQLDLAVFEVRKQAPSRENAVMGPIDWTEPRHG